MFYIICTNQTDLIPSDYWLSVDTKYTFDTNMVLIYCIAPLCGRDWGYSWAKSNMRADLNITPNLVFIILKKCNKSEEICNEYFYLCNFIQKSCSSKLSEIFS